jgi:hypothetical protein
MKRTVLINTITIIALFILYKCGHIEKLPTVSEVEQGDTSYVQMYPDWEKEEYNFNTPKDIFVGNDGYLFIADSGNSRVVVLDQAGSTVVEDEYGNKFQGLADINIPGKGNVQPIRLGQDSKMNLLFIDGGNQIYAWNQYYNNVGIRYVSTEVTLQHTGSGTILNSSRIDSLNYYLTNGYTLVSSKRDSSEDLINSILAPHTFFDGNDPKNWEFVDDYGDTRNTIILDLVAFGKDYGNGIYILDKRYNRIVKLKYIPKYLLVMSDFSVVICYEAVFSEVATGQGTGAGFVMEPKSISIDASGNIYYTQTGGVYSCHGISAGSYRTLFNPGEDDILDIGRFKSAWDVSVDSRGIIYVVDAGSDDIQTFDNRGKFLRNIGTTIVDGVSSNVLNHPEAISISDNTVYVADTGNSRIVRFQYVILAEQSSTNSQ